MNPAARPANATPELTGRRLPPPPAGASLRRLGQVLGQPIHHPSAWYADDMRRRQHEWVYSLSEEDVAELEAATAAAAATGKRVEVGAVGWACAPGVDCVLDAETVSWRRNGMHGWACAPGTRAGCRKPAEGHWACLYEQMRAGQPSTGCCKAGRRSRTQRCLPHAATPAYRQDITLEDFPLPTLGPKLRALLREVTHGRCVCARAVGLCKHRWAAADEVIATNRSISQARS